MITTATADAPTRDVLTRDEAAARAARVSNVSYVLDIDLRSGAETYRGDCTIAFALDGTDGSLFIDFRGRSVERLEVNGEPVPSAVSGERILLGPERLASRMTVRVVYENAFDHAGDGFHRFVDPEDGAEYAYTNFEPFAAHRLFPCFDQPDVKATYRMTVDAPADWVVVTSDPVDAVEELPDGRRRHRFPETRPFSTYLVSLIAGPFHGVFRDRPDGVRLGLYCRQSLARYFADDAEELFTVTEQGFAFLSDLFGQPYPFRKYDQIFCPEFNIGAMENVGAVTFTEHYVFRDPPTERQRQDRAEVVLHELTHMWFGNLVTMRWWGDLWLNESFATYISYLAQAEATRFTGAWKSFVSDIKRWAYRQDQLPTTHPISAPAPDTDTAFLNFDGITYGKGASVLKQLVATIGRDGFRDGIQTYFRRHAWGNATLADFLAALEAGSGQDLDEWARIWLETASLNTLAARWDADDDRVTRLTVEQTAPADFPVLRPHTLVVGLVHEAPDAGGLTVKGVPARLDGPSVDVPDAVGRPRPCLVFPNHEDHAYGKVSLDPISLAFARERVGELDDALFRELLWMSLYEMVRDAELSSLEYLAAIRRHVPQEPDHELIQELMTRAQGVLRWFVPESRREAEASAIVSLALDALPNAEDDDLRITWLRAAIGAASSAPDLEPLLALADGTATVDGVVVDQQMRWDLCVKATAFGLPDGERRIAAELGRDPSDRGQRARIQAEAARPHPDVKAEAWRRIHEEGFGSFHLTRAAMEGFHWPTQRRYLREFEFEFFDRVREVFRGGDPSFSAAYLNLLFPDAVPTVESLERGRALLATLGPDEVMLERRLREKLDDVERSLRVRAFAEGVPSPV